MNSKSTISNAIVGDVEPLLQAVNKIQALIQLRYGTWCVYINTYSLTLPISIETFHQIGLTLAALLFLMIQYTIQNSIYCTAPSTPCTTDLCLSKPTSYQDPHKLGPKLGSPWWNCSQTRLMVFLPNRIGLHSQIL